MQLVSGSVLPSEQRLWPETHLGEFKITAEDLRPSAALSAKMLDIPLTLGGKAIHPRIINGT
jgi:hypothetical protein